MHGHAMRTPRNAGKHAPRRLKELGTTQREPARRSGVSERAVCSFELGEEPGMHPNELRAACRTLDLSLVVERVEPAASRGRHASSKARGSRQLPSHYVYGKGQRAG